MNYIINYPGSACVYVIVFLISLLFAYQGSLNRYIQRNKINIWIISLIVLISVFSGIRGSSVGVDVAHYITRYMEPIKNGYFSSIDDMAVGFKVLVWLGYKLFGQTWAVFVLISFITNSLIVMRLWDFRKQASFTVMIAWYYCFYYLVSFNIFRQFIAIAVIFYCTRFLDNNKYVKFVFGVFIAISIHNISILGFVLIPIHILLDERETLKERKVRSLLLLLSPIILFIVAFLLYRYFDFDHYLRLLNRSTNTASSGLSIPLKMILGAAMYRVVKNRIISCNETYGITLKEFNEITVPYFVGLFVGLAVYISYEAERFTFYFILFELPFVAVKTRKNRNLQFIRFVYFLFMIYTLYGKLASGGSQIMPYVTFWQ